MNVFGLSTVEFIRSCTSHAFQYIDSQPAARIVATSISRNKTVTDLESASSHYIAYVIVPVNLEASSHTRVLHNLAETWDRVSRVDLPLRT